YTEKIGRIRPSVKTEKLFEIALQLRRQAKQGWRRPQDQIGRRRGEIAVQPSLVLEPLSKRRPEYPRPKLRRDAARAERQRKIGGDRAEHRAKHRHRFPRARVVSEATRFGDLRGRERRRGFAGDFAQRAIKINEPRPRKRALRRDMAEAGAQPIEHRAFASVSRGECDMAALAFYRDLPALAPEHPADAQTAAR